MKLEVSRTHALDLATLRQRIEARVTYYDQKYPAFAVREHYAWQGERVVEASYRGGRGRAELEDGRVTLVVELPFFARIYREKIEGFIQREVEAVLG